MRLDTDLENNISHIHPYLGIVLVGSIALMFAIIMRNATEGLTTSIYSNNLDGIAGTIELHTGTPSYGDTIEYTSSVVGISPYQTSTYITTVCFQGSTLVYQYSAQQGVPVELRDIYGTRFEWDGGAASCSATLMYRVVRGSSANVYILDATSFDVAER